MKKMILTLIAVMVASMYTASMASVEMSRNDVRTETRFLTDKMRYELNLDDEQYNDVYEINYDFFFSVSNIMDDVAYGDNYALNTYYNALNIRNDDLRYVLDSDQYERFIRTEYFSRPFYLNNNRWGLEIYFHYEPTVYYYSYPSVYISYYGGHARRNIRINSYYYGRYNHPIFGSVIRFRANSVIRDRPFNGPRFNRDNTPYDRRPTPVYRSFNNNNRALNNQGNTRRYFDNNSNTNNVRINNNSGTRRYNDNNIRIEQNNTRTYSAPNNSTNNNTRVEQNSTRTYSTPSNNRSNNDSKSTGNASGPTRR